MTSRGTYAIHVGSAAVGQGIETVFAQIAGDALDVPLDRIDRVTHGSTHTVSDGFGAYHSRSTAMGGSAILKAADALRAKIRDTAVARLDCPAADIDIVEGRMAVGANGRSMDLADLAGLTAEGQFDNKRLAWAPGAQAAHVAVDTETGRVDVLDYVVVEDVGRVINPLTMNGQLVGATMQGLGGTFLEHFIYDAEGQFLTGSLADYLLPLASDFPKVRAVPLGLHPSPINPLGAKGGGEGGIFSVAGVIANAVAAALKDFNVQPRDLPLSPPQVWQLVQDARQSTAPSTDR